MKSTYAQTIDETELDPRVVRTRHLLLHAFEELLYECGIIRDISIQAIAERAGVNRVTFYAHFTDKYELLEFWKRELFRRKLASQQQNTTTPTLEGIINAVLDFMHDYRRKRRPANQQFEPFFEAAIQNEIQTTLLHMPNIDPETATFLAWAIFGSANHWSLTETPLPKATMSTHILHLANKILP
jgi:AcrR family transcriptional regulator